MEAQTEKLYWKRHRKDPKKPPGPEALFPFAIGLRYVKNPFRFFEELRHDFGKFHMHSSLGQRFYILYKAQDIEHILVRNAKSYSKDLFLKSWHQVFGQGLLTADGDIWKRERRLVQPAFSRDKVSSYSKLMIAETDKELSHLEAAATSNTSVPINREMMRLTLEIASRALFGASLDPSTIKRVGAALDECTSYFEQSFHPIGFFLQKFPVPSVKKYLAAVKDLDDVVFAILKNRQEAPLTENDAGIDQDLLSMLIEARDADGSGLTRKQIRDDVMTLLLAGHETTALALTYTVYLLCKNPTTQKKVQAECDAFFAKGELTTERLSELPFLKTVVQESMRLYPPAWVLARQAVEKDQIGGFDIPVGAQVIIPTWTIHRDPEVYESPEEFRPERWTSEFQANLPRTSYMPFGFGPRMCIGAQFAMNEAMIILAKLFSKFDFSLNGEFAKEPVEVRASITARPKREVMVTLKQR